MPRTILLNNCLLFLCCSIYLGIGVSLVFFQFPVAPDLTPENYKLVFVKPVFHATDFLTPMTIVIYVTAFVMLMSEWFVGIRWVPIFVLVTITAATLLTVYGLFDINNEMKAGVTDPDRLQALLAKWMGLNRIRVSIWALQWLSMMYWFYQMAFKARSDR